METMTITVQMNDGVQAYFKLLPLVPFDEFLENVSDIEDCDDVVFGEQNGLWEIK